MAVKLERYPFPESSYRWAIDFSETPRPRHSVYVTDEELRDLVRQALDNPDVHWEQDV